MSDRALDGLRVVDLGAYLAAPLAAMILADHGADVVRIDPPGGPGWKSDANAVLQRSKRSIVLDLHDVDGASDAQRIIDRADVVLDGFRPGVVDRLGLRRPEQAIWCSLPAFASDDPRAELQGWEGIVGAATGHFTAHPLEGTSRPNMSALPLASTFGALIAVNSVLAALLARLRTGLGQSIEVPLFGAMFEAIGMAGQRLSFPGAVPFTPCSDIDAQGSDGEWVHIVLISPWHYEAFRQAFLPDLGPPSAQARATIIELIGTRPGADWDALINAIGVPCSSVQTMETWLRDDPQARAIDAVVEVVDPELGPTVQLGFGVGLNVTAPRCGPRHALDSDRDEILGELEFVLPVGERIRPTGTMLRGALDGVRVVDMTMVLAGPSAGRILAEFGAEVVKINRPNYWMIGHGHTNSGKLSTLIDVCHPDGRAVLWRLLKGADAFLQNLPVGLAELIGVGEDAVREREPDIVYSSVTAYGRTGTRSTYRGWEPIGQARTGLMMRWGDGVPRFARFAVCDYGTGHLSAQAILLGLYHRARTGQGQHVQTSLVQAGSHHQAPFMIAYPGKRWTEPAGPEALGWSDNNRLFETSDGWVYAVADDLPSEDEFRCHPSEYWEQSLPTVHRLVEIEDLMEDPYVRAQHLSIVRDHPGVGEIRTVGPCVKLSLTPVRVTAAAPAPGWNTRDVVGAEFDELASRGIVADSLPEDVMVVW